MSIIRKPFRYEYRSVTVLIAVLCVVMWRLTELVPNLYRLLALTPILTIRARIGKCLPTSFYMEAFGICFLI